LPICCASCSSLSKTDVSNPRSVKAITTLADFAIVSYCVDAGALAKHLPPGFEPDLLTLADGTPSAFVSAVPFHDLDFRFEALPAARFSFFQTNYRAYVRYRGERCVWFFGTTLASPLVAIPRFLWKLPWHHARTTIDATWERERCARYQLNTAARWGSAELSAGPELEAEPFGSFADPNAASFVLTNPMTGYYYRRDGALGSYAVWHDLLHPRSVGVQRARFDVFERLSLVAPSAAPHSVLVQRTTEFSIYLPPRKVR